MVVAMVAVLMVKTSIDQIIRVIAMWDGFMTAAGPMEMILVMADMTRQRITTGGIGRAHVDHMLIDMIAVRMVKVAVMKVIDMVIMLHGHVAATGTMRMIMMFVMRQIAIRHWGLRVSHCFSDARRRGRRHCRSGRGHGCRR